MRDAVELSTPISPMKPQAILYDPSEGSIIGIRQWSDKFIALWNEETGERENEFSISERTNGAIRFHDQDKKKQGEANGK